MRGDETELAGFPERFFFVLHVGQRLYPASLFYCPRVHDFNETSTYLTAQPSGGRRLFCKRTSADSADDFFFFKLSDDKSRPRETEAGDVKLLSFTLPVYSLSRSYIDSQYRGPRQSWSN